MTDRSDVRLTIRPTDDGRDLVLDPVRQQWVALTPEELVRQILIADLLDLGYPVGLMSVEKGIALARSVWRADLVAYGRDGKALLVAECKAPEVPISQDTFDQLARYNSVLGAQLLITDNGLARYCCRRTDDGWEFLEDIPACAPKNSADG